MSDPIDHTQPSPANEPPAEKPPESVPGKSRRGFWVRLVLGGWIFLILTALIGGYSGYQTGLDDRLATQTAAAADEISHQFQLGLEELVSKQCERARQRFEWVLNQEPNYPGAIEALADAIVCANATATPTPQLPTPTPTITPTPDLRSGEEKFNSAKQLMRDGDWDRAIDTLFALRKEDPNYLAVEVDSMLYVAFRNRGVDKILRRGELESGLFDLSQAELFGPLDSEANGYRNWARLYLIGASFYSVRDWAQAAFYLGQVAPFAPNLTNGSGEFAIDWYIESLRNYVDQLAEAKDWCTAESQLEIYMQYDSDPELERELTRYRNRCEEDRNG